MNSEVIVDIATCRRPSPLAPSLSTRRGRFVARFVTSIAAMLGFAGAVHAEAPAAPTETKTTFVRRVEDNKGGAMLETAAVTYKNTDGVTVTLIGAVHIADPEYFAGLNESFDHYDALLYEMVKPKELAPGAPRGNRRPAGMLGWVGPMQKFMRDHLDLKYQMDAIEYDDRANFVHADLDLDSFIALQEERNEGMLRLMIRAYKAEAQRAKKGEKSAAAEFTPFHLLAALKAGDDRPRKLKLLLSKQLAEMDAQMEALEGPNGSVIITERNKKCFEVLDEQIAAGKKNIGIFYGAGHFPDMEKRLIDMGFKQVGVTWRTAWNMGADDEPTTQPSN